MIEATGLPDHEHPSDHLPIGAVFCIKPLGIPAGVSGTSVVEAPVTPVSSTADVLHEWIEILRMAGLGCQTKALRKQQRKLEAAFLATLDSEEAAALRKWRQD